MNKMPIIAIFGLSLLIYPGWKNSFEKVPLVVDELRTRKHRTFGRIQEITLHKKNSFEISNVNRMLEKDEKKCPAWWSSEPVHVIVQIDVSQRMGAAWSSLKLEPWKKWDGFQYYPGYYNKHTLRIYKLTGNAVRIYAANNVVPNCGYRGQITQYKRRASPADVALSLIGQPIMSESTYLPKTAKPPRPPLY